MPNSGAFFGKLTVGLSLLVASGCAPQETSPVSDAGNLTVDANVSQGTRFIVYCNDVWAKPERQPLLTGQRTKYTFPLPSPLRTLRFDPSEISGSDAEIYSVIIAMRGQPKKALPLTDLPKFLPYHCAVKIQGKTAHVHATGPDMYFMSTVAPDIYPPAPLSE